MFIITHIAIVLDIIIFITNTQFYGIKTILKLKQGFFPGTFFLVDWLEKWVTI